MTYNYFETIEYLLDWYDLNARILPWRENPKPYYVWISEIMLQQTRVEAVKSYFERFIKELPDSKALAEVPEERLLKLWEGLGYYNRARNLKKAAQCIQEEYEGNMPADYKELLKLPGIGSYTAGAISSIAFQIPEPAVDGNVLRVMKRLANSFDDISKGKVKSTLEQDLREIMPVNRPGDFNQAIMELGATVCIPNGKPLCQKCPVMHLCQGFKHNNEMKLPVKSQKKPRKIEERTLLLFEKTGQYRLQKRPEKGLLAGLWELPYVTGRLPLQALEEYLKESGIRYESIEPLGEGKHIFSHIEWQMLGYSIKLPAEEQVRETSSYVKDREEGFVWADRKEIDEVYTLPSAFDTYKKFMI